MDIVNVSGGVDSTAVYLLRLEQGDDFLPVFADTGNEHEITLEYINTLAERTGGPKVVTVKADFGQRIIARRYGLEIMLETGEYKRGWTEESVRRVLEHLHPTGIPMLDLCMWKGMFPSNRRRICTVALKLETIRDKAILPAISNALDDGLPASSVVSWIGIRRDESPDRADALEWEDEPFGARIYRPLVEWSKQRCFALLKRHNIVPNPLYKMGCSRVGCMPCINANKDEICNMAKRWPRHIDKIREWEQRVGACRRLGVSTFFNADKTPGVGDARSHIDAVVEWSMTARGGRQYDMLRQMDPPACSSLYGLCE